MKRRAFDAIVFDLDGTLIDTLPDMIPALNAALEACGLSPVERCSMRAATNAGLAGMAAEALRLRAADSRLLPALLRDFERRYGERLCVDSRPYSGARALLTSLELHGIKCGVCTNKPERLARELLDATGLGGLVAAIVGGDTTALTKPSPIPLLHILKLIDSHPASTLFVGDSEVDLACGRAAGVAVALVAHGYASDPGIYERELALGDLGQVARWIEDGGDVRKRRPYKETT